MSREGEVLSDCSTFWRCFLYVLNQGLRNGGGISDAMTSDVESYYERFFLDLSFFLVVNIILLNVVFGIILDTFSELRAQKEEAARLVRTGNDSLSTLNFFTGEPDDGDGLKRIRSYVSFIIYIYEQNKDDDDGLEIYVRKQIDTGDTTWFPDSAADNETSTGEELAPKFNDLKEMVEELGNSFNRQIRALEGKLDGALQSLDAEAALQGMLRSEGST